MTRKTAQAAWKGSLEDGSGSITLGSGVLEGSPFSFATRFEDKKGTQPEELIGGAHAACFSMAFAHMLGENGHPPKTVQTRATVELQKKGEGFEIPRISLDCEASVPGIEDKDFQKIASEAKENCPVSKLVSSAEISLTAVLTGA